MLSPDPIRVEIHCSRWDLSRACSYVLYVCLCISHLMYGPSIYKDPGCNTTSSSFVITPGAYLMVNGMVGLFICIVNGFLCFNGKTRTYLGTQGADLVWNGVWFIVGVLSIERNSGCPEKVPLFYILLYLHEALTLFRFILFTYKTYVVD